MFDVHTAAQTHHICGAVAAFHAFPAGVVGPVFFNSGDLLITALWCFGHVGTPELIEMNEICR